MIINIGNTEIGEGCKPYFIADIAANHDGDLNRAYSLIELAKEAGADAAKFQNFKADTIVSKYGFCSINTQLSHQKAWKKSVYETYRDASLPDEWSARLKEKCDSAGIEYMTSPYDYSSVDLADQYANCFKIGSGDITWTDIIKYIAQKGKPLLLATGASGMDDVHRAMAIIQKYNNKIVLMQCNTNYTADISNFKNINLNVLKTYRAAYPDVILGLSDHTRGHETVLGAIALGARVIEKHFTDDNDRAGPDHKFSMTPVTWRDMVVSANLLYSALGDGIKRIEKNEEDTAVIQRRSLYYTQNIASGEKLRETDLFPLRPILDTGIPPYDTDKLIGKTLKKGVVKNDAVKWEDFI
ncbi:MAG: N-acetylneuraminate synthase family protein [Deferribacteraceae bacterium]|jgi:N-acetylneuraminate synthase|nr:N-acetylneuraminate synthase family protein [Deferribacteraceae bacterium]